MSTEYGVYSSEAGGFLETQCYSREQAATALAAFVAQGENAQELSIEEICAEHEEQISDACEKCE